jgi:hypothetical protein
MSCANAKPAFSRITAAIATASRGVPLAPARTAATASRTASGWVNCAASSPGQRRPRAGSARSARTPPAGVPPHGRTDLRARPAGPGTTRPSARADWQAGQERPDLRRCRELPARVRPGRLPVLSSVRDLTRPRGAPRRLRCGGGVRWAGHAARPAVAAAEFAARHGNHFDAMMLPMTQPSRRGQAGRGPSPRFPRPATLAGHPAASPPGGSRKWRASETLLPPVAPGDFPAGVLSRRPIRCESGRP